MSETDDAVLCRYEWNLFLESIPEMDIKRTTRRTPDFYLILLDDTTVMFDRTDWDAVMSLALKDLKDC